MSGQGNDRRRRLDRLPAGVVTCRSGEDRATRRLEGDDPDLDLRPPDNPGAESGNFLKTLDGLLAGGDEFYELVADDPGVDRTVLTAAQAKAKQAPPLGCCRAGRQRNCRSAQPRAAPGGSGSDLAAQGLPHPRSPCRPPRPARGQTQGRSRAGPGDRAPTPS